MCDDIQKVFEYLCEVEFFWEVKEMFAPFLCGAKYHGFDSSAQIVDLESVRSNKLLMYFFPNSRYAIFDGSPTRQY